MKAVDGTRAKRCLDRGRALRLAQRTEEAVIAIDEAAALAPDDAEVALARAYIHLETWRPAADLFARARRSTPDDPTRLSGHATALTAEGQGEAAVRMLDATLIAHPDWVNGHRQLAQLRLATGDGAGFDRSFSLACAARPDLLPLRLAWFHLLATARDWTRARQVLADGIVQFGAKPALTSCEVFLASESEEASRDPHLFDRVSGVRDPGLDLCRVRFWLRNGRPDLAEGVATAQIDGAAARTFWPYLSLAWRLTGDARAGWLDDPAFVSAVDLGIPPAERQALADLLRSLLAGGRLAIEQSVRGGVQTDRNLFFHHDTRIRQLRERATAAVQRYVRALPPPVPGHPLLGPSRETVTFEGSWSVLLRGAGHHAPHTHSRGWISSALYIDLPDLAAEADRQAGWIEFGTPPPELNLDLAPASRVAPGPGRLALFPSTTWHRTRPFSAGERLTVSFDVAETGARR